MTNDQIRQIKKNEALNKIRKLYVSFKSDPYDGDSSGEQRDYYVRRILEDLDTDLAKLK